MTAVLRGHEMEMMMILVTNHILTAQSTQSHMHYCVYIIIMPKSYDMASISSP